MEPGKSPQSCEAAGQAEALVKGTASTSALLCFRQVRQVPLCPLPWGSYQGSLLAEPEHRGPRSLNPQIHVIMTLQDWGGRLRQKGLDIKLTVLVLCLTG